MRKYLPKHEACPDCGGKLKHLGEDVSEILEYVPAQFQSDPAGSSRSWPARVAIASCKRKHRAGRSSEASLVRGFWPMCWFRNTVTTSRLYRQSEIYAREGVELDRSTLADWVGGTSRLLAPLVEALRRHVMAATSSTPMTRRFRCWRRARENKNGTAVDLCAR